MNLELDTITKTYLKTLDEVQFNSFASLYKILDKEYPANFGTDCIGQCIHLIKNLKKINIDGKFIASNDHHAVIIGEKLNLCLLDTIGTHKEVIQPYRNINDYHKLTFIKNKRGGFFITDFYSSFGSPKGVSSHNKSLLQTTLFGKGFALEKHGFKRAVNGTKTEFKAYYDLSKPLDMPIGWKTDSMKEGSRNNPLFLRSIDIKNDSATYLYYFNYGSFENSKLFISTNEKFIVQYKEKEKFEEAVIPILKKYKISLDELILFIKESANLQNQLRKDIPGIQEFEYPKID